MKTVYKENSKNRCDITEKSAAVGTASGNYGTKTVKTKKKSKIMPKNHSDSAVLYGTVARKLMIYRARIFKMLIITIECELILPSRLPLIRPYGLEFFGSIFKTDSQSS